MISSQQFLCSNCVEVVQTSLQFSFLFTGSIYDSATLKGFLLCWISSWLIFLKSQTLHATKGKPKEGWIDLLNAAWIIFALFNFNKRNFVDNAGMLSYFLGIGFKVCFTGLKGLTKTFELFSERNSVKILKIFETGWTTKYSWLHLV